MEDDFSKAIVSESKRIRTAYKEALIAYSPESRRVLTRRHWNENRNSPGEMYNLTSRFGQAKVDKWAQSNTLRDSLEVRQ